MVPTNRLLHIYTIFGVLKSTVFRRYCLGNGQCNLDWEEGKSDGLHVYSNVTAATDEIGYLYEKDMLGGGKTFTAFCEQMNFLYKSGSPNAASFMSTGTFIAWWLSWAASHRYDFRMPCPSCMWSPNCLVGDGTLLGMSLKKSDFPPIETRTNEQPIDTPNKRMDRCFLSLKDINDDVETSCDEEETPITSGSLKEAREHLLLMSESIAKKEKYNFKTDGEKKQFFRAIPKMCRMEINRYLSDEMLGEVRPFGELLKILGSTVPLSSVVPQKFCNDVKSLIAKLPNKCDEATFEEINGHLFGMKKFSIELFDYVTKLVFEYDDVPHSAIDLINYIVSRVQSTSIIPAEPAREIPHTYNPAKLGRAYYFRPSGQQIRQPRLFSIDGVETDDRPEAERCQKKYPKLSRSGMSFVFSWFCGHHHHSYSKWK